jgi:hypothetical protein
MPETARSDGSHIVSDTHLRLSIQGMEDVICLPVTEKHVFQCLDSRRSLPKAGRHASIQIATEEKDVRFIEGDPIANPSKYGDHFLDVHQVFLNRPIFMPWIFLKEPTRVGKMVEGDHGFNVFPAEDIDNVLIMSNGLHIPSIFLGLYPTPL